MYALLLSLIYLAFVSLGLPDSLLGAAWPIMHQSFQVPLSQVGLVTMTISASTILSSLLSERVTKKFGTGWVTVVSVFLTAGALMGFSFATAFWMLLLWAIPYGLGAGAIDAAMNNYVALHYNSRHMSWLHCFWGVGALISPYVMSWALTYATWPVGYQTVGFVQLGIGALLLISLPLWRIHKAADTEEENTKILGMRGAFAIRGVLPLVLGFFCYCAAETTCMFWCSSYLVEARGFAEETAAALASLFFIGMTVGRFLAGFIADRAGDRRMIRFGTGLAILGFLLILLPVKANGFALAGFLLAGLGCAPIYPSIIHTTPVCFGAKNSQAIIGIQMAFAYTGSTFMSPLFGLLAQYVAMELLPVYLLIFFGFMTFMLEKTYKICRPNE
jgi:fucose permease